MLRPPYAQDKPVKGMPSGLDANYSIKSEVLTLTIDFPPKEFPLPLV